MVTQQVNKTIIFEHTSIITIILSISSADMYGRLPYLVGTIFLAVQR